MTHPGFRSILCAALLASAPLIALAAPEEDSQARLQRQLLVQKALQEGRDNLQRGSYQAAVTILESQVAHIDGNRDYLRTLCDAYQGLIKDLCARGRSAEAVTFQEKLRLLGFGADLSRPASCTSAPAPPPPPRPLAEKVRGGPTVRGMRPDSTFDPFSDDNSRQRRDARALVERANRSFESREYLTASRLYEEAFRTDHGIVEPCQDKWGYCILVGVSETLKTSRPSASQAAALRSEVERAVRLTPKLKSQGQELLRAVANGVPASGTSGPREESRVAVRHQPIQSHGWAVAETTNFRILHTLSQEKAEEIVLKAEATRSAMARKWFGDDLPRWNPPCDIYVHASGANYARLTGKPAGLPGHSSILQDDRDASRVISRRIDVHADNPKMLDSILPHETTHVVLAGGFGRHLVPRWADEGMAVLTEPQAAIAPHLSKLVQHRAERQLFSVAQLMQMKDYPEARLVGPFYAQSVSLVKFLSEKNGPLVFARFLRDGLDRGYESALARHYGFRSFDELEQQWRQQAFSNTDQLANSEH